MVDAIIGMPKWLEPTGFVSFAPALCGKSGGCGSADHPKLPGRLAVQHTVALGTARG
jgi:hypothetical protein